MVGDLRPKTRTYRWAKIYEDMFAFTLTPFYLKSFTLFCLSAFHIYHPNHTYHSTQNKNKNINKYEWIKCERIKSRSMVTISKPTGSVFHVAAVGKVVFFFFNIGRGTGDVQVIVVILYCFSVSTLFFLFFFFN